MSEKNLHQLAAIHSYRFNTTKGDMLLEDLYSLPLEASSPSRPSLNTIAIELHNQLQATELSFVKTSSKSDTHTRNKLELVKEVIAYRLAENDKKAEQMNKAERRRVIFEALQARRFEALQSQDLETLEREYRELGGN